MTIFRTTISAFLESEETKAIVDQAFADRRLEKAITDSHLGGAVGAVAHFAENNTPNLIIIESALSGDELLESIGGLADVCDEGTEVLVLGAVNDVATYRSLTQEGVSDYLVSPFTPIQIYQAIESVAIDSSEPPRGRVIAFIGAKGGTGSSTVAHNIAWSLAHIYDDDVVVLDLDLAFGTLGMAFNMESEQGIVDALAQPDRLDEVLLKRYMSMPEDHLMLLSARGALDSDANIDVESFDTLLDLVRKTAPFIVLDLPNLWTTWTQHVLKSSEEIVVTSMLDLACLRDSKNLVDTLTAGRPNDAPIRLVVNHQGAFRKSELSTKDFEHAVGSSPDLIIAHDPALFGTATNNGQMIGVENARHKVTEGFNALAQTISGIEPPRSKKGEPEKASGALSFLTKLRKG